jgi:small subunit ribosomal protein S21
VTTVVLREGESPQQLIRRFRKKVSKSRILSDVKKKRYHIKKSEERRVARRKAVRKELRRQRKQRRKNRR